MKPTRFIILAVMALALANGYFAAAQTNSSRVPGSTDYDRFSQFITERNIFNPQRYARDYSQPTVHPPPRFAPQFTLVGTMSYEKGMFAFFDGNQSNLRKVLYPSDTNGIAGFTIASITFTNVVLQSADQKQTQNLQIGEGMVQAGDTWQLASRGGFSGRSSYDESTRPAADSPGPDTGTAPGAASSSSLEGNDVLKRLMQQRQQELK